MTPVSDKVLLGDKDGKVNTKNEWIEEELTGPPILNGYEIINDIRYENGNLVNLRHKVKTAYIFDENGEELLQFSSPLVVECLF